MSLESSPFLDVSVSGDFHHLIRAGIPSGATRKFDEQLEKYGARGTIMRLNLDLEDAIGRFIRDNGSQQDSNQS